MRSAAAAFAWEFRRRLRWGLIALGVYLAVLALVQFVILGPRSPIHPLSEMTFALTVLVPVSFAFLYFLAVFSYGLAGDLTARHSLYPARMFTLPVSTAALAGWPMLYGTTTLAALWLVAALIALRPSGVPAPLVWPALFAAAFIAWLQAFAWMPYGLPGLRMIVAVLWLTTIDAVVFTAMEMKVRESLMVAIMAPQVPLAYLTARYAVGRARCGDTPDWRGVFARLGRVADVLPRRRGGFPSAARAQAWFEWRQHGRSLPAWVAILVPFEVFFLYLVRHEPAVLTMIALVALLLTPPFLAAFVAVTVARSNADASNAYGLSPFIATRPLRTVALVAAKLRMALASTLFAWLLILVATPLALTMSGTWPVVIDWAREWTGFLGAPRAVVVALLCLLGLLAATWKQLVQGLAVGLTGREGLIKSSVLVRLSLLVLIGLIAELLYVRRDARILLWNALPWIPAVPVFLKVCAAAWIATRLSHDRLLGDRALVAGAAAWLAAVLALYGVLVWILDTALIGHFFLVLLAILAVPVVRPSAVLLALASNRHRGTVAPAETGAGGRRRALAAARVLLAAPVALAVVTCAAFCVRNRDNGGFVSSGEERTYRLYVPKGYDRTRPTPLVISLHGGGGWGAAQMEVSQWNEVADEQGILVVYPSGVGGRGPRAWRAGAAVGEGSEKDVRFIAELIETLSASYPVDPTRIYADGLSNGGGMAVLLSCTLSDRIAAVGLVGAAHFLPWSACRDEKAVPMIAFHGTDDRFAHYHGGTSWVARGYVFPSIPAFTAGWARRNRCGGKPVESAVAADVTRLEYPGCADDAAVVLYTIRGGGHTWPGGGPMPEWFAGTTSRGVDATRQAWAFFRAHPLVR
jgi:poly(3-hydroxybutyrate) depolymerase